MPVLDIHAHLDDRMLDIPAMIEKMDRAGIDKVALIPCMNDPLPETPTALLAVVRTLMQSPLSCCARMINNALMTPEGDLKLRGQIYRIYPEPDMEPVARAIRAHPDRFVGWIFLNPRTGDALEQLEQWRAHPGFIGVKLHPHWHGYPLEEALPIAERCEELSLPILIHLGFGDGGRWQLLTDRCPALRVVFAHAGMPHFARMWGAMRAHPGLYVDVSSPYLNERLARRAVAALGPRRVLFGTDAPYGFHDTDSSYDYTHIRRWVERMPSSAREIDAMLGDNAEELIAERR